MTAQVTEMRKERRYRGAYPVFVGNTLCATRDMSTSGVYFWKEGLCTYARGDTLRFAIELETAKGRIMWNCRGAVVRTEPIGNMAGVAVKLIESKMVAPWEDTVRSEVRSAA